MKSMVKLVFCLLLVCGMLAVPFAASAEEASALLLMPTDESGYTIVEGDGTVAIEDGKLLITNNGDGDFRVLINNTNGFDLTTLNALEMHFNTEMPFKMAYHLISNADATSDWLTTSTEFLDVFELDAAADRTLAGDYDVTLDVNSAAVDIADKSDVYFEQFIILVTGKGTFTLNGVSMVSAEMPSADSDDTEADVPADEELNEDAASDESDETTTTTQKSAPAEEKDTFPLWLLIVILAAVVAVVGVCVVVIAKRPKS